MGTNGHNPAAQAGEALLDLLHREADGDLTPDEAQRLQAQLTDPAAQAARLALQRVGQWLQAAPPAPLPHSVAPEVAADVALSLRLKPPGLPASVAARAVTDLRLTRHLGQPPPLPRSVATAVLSDIRSAQQLGGPPLPLPASVAASVATDIRLDALLGAPVRLPHSVAAAVLTDLALDRQLAQSPVPPLPRSVAASVFSRLDASALAPDPFPAQPAGVSTAPELAPLPLAAQDRPAAALGLTGTLAAPVGLPVAGHAGERPRNPAPLLLVGALLLGLTLLALTTAWPNLAAGAVVLRTLLAQVSPLAGVGLLLLLLTSALISWKPLPSLRTAGAGAFALSAVLTLPALYHLVGGASGLQIGRAVTINGPVRGNVIAIGGNVNLQAGARVGGEVITLMGDVHRDPSAQVGGRISALLGHAPGDAQTTPALPGNDLSLATAAAFRPVLGWLGGAAWPQIFVALTGALLLTLFVGGVAPQLARRQRHAPIRTLALGVLLLSALLWPALGLALVGLLGPALVALALAALLIATGLSVSVYDMGRILATRLHLPVPDAVGAMMGLSAFAASLSYHPLAFALALVGGTWGAGALLLTRQGRE